MTQSRDSLGQKFELPIYTKDEKKMFASHTFYEIARNYFGSLAMEIDGETVPFFGKKPASPYNFH